MFVAGIAELAARARRVRRRLPDGRRRERGEHVHGPRHRRPHGAHAAASDPERTHARRGGARVRRAAARRRRRSCSRTSRTCSRRRSRSRGFYFYVFIYTRWLKRSSPQNIVIGGAAGAFPPLVGWAAVTGPRRPARRLPLPHRLLLDAAALLGARAAQAARLRPRRRADGAARVGRARDDAADALVHADPHSAHAAAGGVRRVRDPSISSARVVARRRSVCAGRDRASIARDASGPSPRGGCTSSRCSISRCSSRRWSSTALIRRLSRRSARTAAPLSHARARTRRGASASPKPLGTPASRACGRTAARLGRRARVCLRVARRPSALAFPQVVRHLLDAAFQQHDRALLDRIAARADRAVRAAGRDELRAGLPAHVAPPSG